MCVIDVPLEYEYFSHLWLLLWVHSDKNTPYHYRDIPNIIMFLASLDVFNIVFLPVFKLHRFSF